MSYTINHWVLVNGIDGTCRGEIPAAETLLKTPRAIEWARKIAIEIFGPRSVSQVLLGNINFNFSDHISICPDGSGEGWDESDLGDRRRAQYIASLIMGRIKLGHILTWTVFGLGEDGDGPSIMEYHDPFFYALVEGDPVSDRRSNVTLDQALTPLDLLVPGPNLNNWKQRVRARGKSTVLDDEYRRIVEMEVTAMATLLDIPNKYGAFKSRSDFTSGDQALYDELMRDAQTCFPGALKDIT